MFLSPDAINKETSGFVSYGCQIWQPYLDSVNSSLTMVVGVVGVTHHVCNEKLVQFMVLYVTFTMQW